MSRLDDFTSDLQSHGMRRLWSPKTGHAAAGILGWRRRRRVVLCIRTGASTGASADGETRLLLRLRQVLRRRCRHQPPNLVYCMLDGVEAASLSWRRRVVLAPTVPRLLSVRRRGCYPYGGASGHLGYVLTAGHRPGAARRLVGLLDLKAQRPAAGVTREAHTRAAIKPRALRGEAAGRVKRAGQPQE